MRRLIFGVLILSLVTLNTLLQPSQPQPVLDITGVNASELPTATITLNVMDILGVPVAGLTAEDFTLSGELAEFATIERVESISVSDLPFSVVLVIDTSSSMAGYPFDQAKQAAREFINAIGDNDPVAIVAFSSDVRLVQNYTSDKATLLNAIDTLQYGGQTALYEGAVFGVNKAAESPTPRRAVVLLSDGAEYGLSRAAREDALTEAFKQGVSVYTIGLGYGTDRSYLQELSTGTEATNYESPSAEQLVEIYNNLAGLLRSQYVMTLNVDVPLDGTEYEFSLQAETPKGQSTVATSVLRAPIPVPIVSISGGDGQALTQSTDFTANVAADDELVEVNAVLGEDVTQLEAEPYTLTVDPFLLSPGTYTLTFNAIDVDNDTGSASLDLTVAALPAVVTISPDLSTLGELNEPITLLLEMQEQTPTTGVRFSVDGEVIAEDITAPYELTLTPFDFAPGSHTLTVAVTSESGAVGEVSQPFTVAGLPPVVELRGLQPNQEISEPTTFNLDALGQTPVQEVTVTLNDQELTADANGAYTITPMNLPPGNVTLSVTVTDESGQTTTLDTPLRIAALPPVVTIAGLTEGETLTEARTIEVQATSQSPLDAITIFIGGQEVARLTEAPYTFTLEPLDFAPQSYPLEVTVIDAAEQVTTQTLNFEFSEAPFLTATPPTTTPTDLPTDTPTMTYTPSPTVDTAATEAYGTLVAQSTRDAESTLNARSTSTAEAVINATATMMAQMTSAAASTLDTQATGTQVAQATREQRAAALAVQRQETADARATLTAEPSETTVPTDTRTPRPPTSTATEVPTEEPTETVIPSDTPTDEPTDESTETAVPSDTPTDEPTLTETPAATEEPTEVAQVIEPTPTLFDPTSTPVGELTEIEAQSAPEDNNLTALLAIVCGGGLLLILIIVILVARSRQR